MPDEASHTDVPGRAADRERDERLVRAIRNGHESAFSDLYDAWFDRVFEVARRIVRDDGLAADVAQDAFLSAWKALPTLSDPASFGGWILRISRNRALDRLAREKRSSPVDGEVMTMIEHTAPSQTAAPNGFTLENSLATATDPQRAVADADVAALVWEAADALGPRDASVLDLHLRHGLSNAEIATELGVETNAANQVMHRLRGRLGKAVQARVLWQSGRPACNRLRTDLDHTGVHHFDANAVKTINKHALSCQDCERRQKTRTAPTALFAATPLIAAPFLLKSQVAYALAQSGIPISSSTAIGPLGDSDATGQADSRGADSKGPRRGGGRAVKIGAIIASLIVAAMIALVVFAPGVDRSGQDIPVAIGSPSAAPTPSPAPTDDGNDSDEPAGEPIDDPAQPDPTAPTTQPPPPPRVRISISPSVMSAKVPTTRLPTATWSVTGEFGSTEVVGPGLSSTSPSDSAPVCPGDVTTDACVSPVGTYEYVLYVYDSKGELIELESALLTVA